MDIPTLFSDFSRNGVVLALAGGRIKLTGSVESVTAEQESALREHAKEVFRLLELVVQPPLKTEEPFEPRPDDERDAIQWAEENPTEATAVANRVGDWFLKQSPQRRKPKTYGQLSREVSQLGSIDELNQWQITFHETECDRETKNKIFSLLNFQRLWLSQVIDCNANNGEKR